MERTKTKKTVEHETSKNQTWTLQHIIPIGQLNDKSFLSVIWTDTDNLIRSIKRPNTKVTQINANRVKMALMNSTNIYI